MVLPLYPVIVGVLNVTVSPITAANVLLNVSGTGWLHCAPFETTLNSVTRSQADIRAHATSLVVDQPGLHVIKLLDLNPETTYDVYCSSNNFGSTAVMPYEKTLASKWSVFTGCCKGITVDFVHPYIMPYTSATPVIPEALFTARMNARHATAVDFTAAFEYVACPWNATAYNLRTPIIGQIDIYPHTLHFQPSTLATVPAEETVQFAVRTQIEGCFRITLKQFVNGGVSTYQSFSFFLPIRSYKKAIPSPQIAAVEYAYNAEAIYIDFDIQTDRAASQLYPAQTVGSTFNCSQIFKFSGAVSSSCRWDTNQRVIVQTLTQAAPVPVGSVVEVLQKNKGRYIRPLCVSQQYFPCPDVDYNYYPTPNIVPVRLPPKSVQPIVRLIASSRMALCDSMVIDATQSTGNGKRRWQVMKWYVSAVTAPDATGQGGGMPVDSSTLVKVLQSNCQSTLTVCVISAPSGAAPPWTGEVRYTISLKLTNFLGAVSLDSFTIEVSSYAATPQITMQQPSSIRINRWEPIDLRVVPTIPACAGVFFLTSALTYSWTLSKVSDSSRNQTTLALESVFLSSIQPDINPTRFFVPAYALNHSTTYIVEVAANYDVNNNLFFTFGRAKTSIIVNKPLVFAAITGGSFQTITNAQPFSFDGSTSIDSLAPVPSLSLKYLWNCMEVYPIYGKDCNVAPSTKVMQTFQAGSLRSNQRYRMSLSVTNTAGYRDYASILVSVVGSQNARVKILSAPIDPTLLSPDAAALDATAFNNYASKVRCNNDAKMVVMASLDAPYSIRGTWQCTYGCTSSIGAMSTVATNINLFAGLNVFPMILSPLSLAGGGTDYVFTLTSSVLTIAPTQASVVISVNAPPNGGTFAVSPIAGYAFTTPFQMSASHWVDDPSDYPISYRFSCFTLYPSSRYVVRPLSLVNRASAYLSQGYNYRRFLITCYGEIVDNMMSTATSTFVGVTVRPTYNLVSIATSANLNAVMQQMSTALIQVNTTASYQLINTVSAALNGVDCGQVPVKCLDINRFDCGATPQTCGQCLSDNLVGPSGDSNVPCVAPKSLAALFAIGGLCNSNADCQTSFCDPSAGICSLPQKSCWNACSGRGSCLFFDQLGNSIKSCLSADSNCFAKCICSSNYAGNDCSLSTSLLATTQSTRGNLCTQLLATSQYENPVTNEVVLNRAYAISNILAGDVLQMSTSNFIDCNSVLVNTFVAMARQPMVSQETIAAMLGALSNSLKYRSILEALPNIQLEILDMTRLLFRQTQTNILPGESSISAYYPSMRVISMLTRKEDLATLKLSTPQTAYEQILGLTVSPLTVDTSEISALANPIGLSIVEFASGSNAPIFGSCLVNTTILGIEVTQFDAQSYLTIAQGSPVLNRRLPSVGDKLTWIMPLRHYASVDYKNYEASQMIVPCFNYSSSPYSNSMTCPSGVIVTVQCPAFQKGAFNTTCPLYVMEPKCMSFNGTSFVPDIACRVIDHSSANITCQCTMFVNSTTFPLYSANSEPALSINRTTTKIWTPLGYSGSRIYAGGIIVHSAGIKMSFMSYPHFTATFDNSIFLAACAFIGFGIVVLLILIGYRQIMMPKSEALTPAITEDETRKDLVILSSPLSSAIANPKLLHRTIRSFYDEMIPTEIHPQTSWPMKVWLHIKHHNPFIELITQWLEESSKVGQEPVRLKAKSIPEHWWDVSRMIIIAVCLATIATISSFSDDGTCEAMPSSEKSCLSFSPLGKQAWYIFAPSTPLTSNCGWLPTYVSCVFQDSPILESIPLHAVNIFVLMSVFSVLYVLTAPIMTFSDLWNNVCMAFNYWVAYVQLRLFKVVTAQPKAVSSSKSFTAVEEWREEKSNALSFDEFARCQKMRGKLLTAARLARMLAVIDGKIATQETLPIIDELSTVPKTYLTKYHSVKVLKAKNYQSAFGDDLGPGRFRSDNIVNVALSTTVYHQELLQGFYGGGVAAVDQRVENKALVRVQNARQHSARLLGEMATMRDNQIREKYLMTRFIVDCLPKHCQAAAVRMFSENFHTASIESKQSAGSIRSIAFGTTAALIQLAALAAMAIYTLTVTPGLGSRSLPVWLTIVGFLLIEALVFLPPLFAVLAIAIQTPTLLELSKVINVLLHQSHIILVRSRGHLSRGNKNILVQHFNVACRAARHYPELPVARLIIRVNDTDLFTQEYKPAYSVSEQLSCWLAMLDHWLYHMFTSGHSAVQDIACQVVSSLFVSAVVIASFYLTEYVTSIGVAFIVVVAALTITLWSMRTYLFSWYLSTALIKRKEAAKEKQSNTIFTHSHYSSDLERIKEMSNPLAVTHNHVASARKKRQRRWLLGRGWVGVQLQFVVTVVKMYFRRMCNCCFTPHAAVKDYSLSDVREFEEFSDDEDEQNDFLRGRLDSERSESSEDSFLVESRIQRQPQQQQKHSDKNQGEGLADETKESSGGVSTVFRLPVVPISSDESANLPNEGPSISLGPTFAPTIGPPLQGAPMASYISVTDMSMTSIRQHLQSRSLLELPNGSSLLSAASESLRDKTNRKVAFSASVESLDPPQQPEGIALTLMRFKEYKAQCIERDLRFKNQPPVLCYSDDFDLYNYSNVAPVCLVTGTAQKTSKRHKNRRARSRFSPGKSKPILIRRDVAGMTLGQEFTHVNGLQRMIYALDPSLVVTDKTYKRYCDQLKRAKKLRLREFSSTGPGYKMHQELNLARNPHTPLLRYMLFGEDGDVPTGYIATSGIERSEQVEASNEGQEDGLLRWNTGQKAMNRGDMLGSRNPAGAKREPSLTQEQAEEKVLKETEGWLDAKNKVDEIEDVPHLTPPPLPPLSLPRMVKRTQVRIAVPGETDDNEGDAGKGDTGTVVSAATATSNSSKAATGKKKAPDKNKKNADKLPYVPFAHWPHAVVEVADIEEYVNVKPVYKTYVDVPAAHS